MSPFPLSFQIFFIVGPDFHLDFLHHPRVVGIFLCLLSCSHSHQLPPPVLALGSSLAACFQQRCK